jgi:pyruvate formate lyase activating enzyme
MMNVRSTSPEELLMAYEIAKSVGLRYVYVWNLYLPWYEDTYCPNCWEKLIARAGFVSKQLWEKPGVCPKCWTKIPWRWE